MWLPLQFIFLEEDEEQQRQHLHQKQQQQNNFNSKGMPDFSNERPTMYNDHYLQGKTKIILYILFINIIIYK